jgi:hypothetical protein
MMQPDLVKRARDWAEDASRRGDVATAIRFRALASAIEELVDQDSKPQPTGPYVEPADG